MKSKKTREATAYARAQILNPLLSSELDRSLRAHLLREASEQSGVVLLLALNDRK